MEKLRKLVRAGLRSRTSCFLLWLCDKPDQTGSYGRSAPVSRAHTVRFTVQRSFTTLYWRARGTIEYTEAGRFWTFIMTGASDTFTTEAEAKDGFIQQAEKWVNDRLGSKSPL
jgi:hypothetical protein